MPGSDGAALPMHPTPVRAPASQGPAQRDRHCNQQAEGSPCKVPPRPTEPVPVPGTRTDVAIPPLVGHSEPGPPPAGPRFLLEVLPRLNVARLLVHAPSSPVGPTGASTTEQGPGAPPRPPGAVVAPAEQGPRGPPGRPGAVVAPAEQGRGAAAGGAAVPSGSPSLSGTPLRRPGAWLEEGHCIRVVRPGLVRPGQPEGAPPALSELWVPLPAELLPRINWAACAAHHRGAHQAGNHRRRHQQQQRGQDGGAEQVEGGPGHVPESLPLPVSWSQSHAELKIPLLAQPALRREEGARSCPEVGTHAGSGCATGAATTESLVHRLAANAPLQVLCRSCSREVSAPGASLREFVELPPLGSALEMSEQWFCGGCCAEAGGPRHAQRVMEALQRRLHVQPGKALVGPTALVVHPSDVRLPLITALPGAPGAEEGSAIRHPLAHRATKGTASAGIASSDTECASSVSNGASCAPPTPAAAQGIRSPQGTGSADQCAEESCCDRESRSSGGSHASTAACAHPCTGPATQCAGSASHCTGDVCGEGAGAGSGPQSWELPEMLPGREPWGPLRCACRSVLGAARVHRRGAAQEAAESAAGATAARAPVSGEDRDSPERPMEPPGEDADALGGSRDPPEGLGEPSGQTRDSPEDQGEGKGEQGRGGGVDHRSHESAGAPPVHLYPHRVELVAPGHSCGVPPLSWSTEGAYALKLAQLFSPGAGAGLAFSSRLLVRDLNAPHAPLLQLLLLDCHGLLAPGTCTPRAPQAPQGCTAGVSASGAPRAARPWPAGEGDGVPEVNRVAARLDQLGLTPVETGVREDPAGNGTSTATASTHSSNGMSRVPCGSTSHVGCTSHDQARAAEGWESSKGSPGRAPLERAVRVLFRTRASHAALCSAVAGAPSTEDASAMEAWAQKGGAEELHMMQDEAKELQKALEGNAMFYPPAVRGFDGFVCSFLCLPK